MIGFAGSMVHCVDVIDAPWVAAMLSAALRVMVSAVRVRVVVAVQPVCTWARRSASYAVRACARVCVRSSAFMGRFCSAWEILAAMALVLVIASARVVGDSLVTVMVVCP